MPSLHLTRDASLAAAIAVLMLAPPARAQYFGRNKVQYESFDFKVLSTEHFDLYYYQDERAMAEQAGRMAERWYQRLSKTLDTELRGRQPIILYASHPDFEQTNAIPGTLDESTGGVTESFKRRIVLPLAGSLAETDHVIGHELVHAFQYDLQRRGEGNPLDPGAQLPLWFVEGMAEYLSVGAGDPNTAMWIRDSARQGKLPTIARLDNARYFPYRFGQAFWAYVADRFGEASIGRVLKAASGRGARVEQVLGSVLGLPADSLSRDWHRAIQAWAGTAGRPGPPAGPHRRGSSPAPNEGRARGAPGPSAMAAPDSGRRSEALGRSVIAPRGELGRLNVGPSLSPDGTRLSFLSERDLFSIEMFVADAATGRVLRRLTRSAVDPHLESLEFVHSAGDWSPDGRRIAVATVSGGKPALVVLDAESGRTVERIGLPGLGEILQPTWSPDGRRVAFTAIANGATDLFVVELRTRALERLTEDLYADLEPAWSPDGRTLAFATDRFSTRLGALEYGETRLALLDLETRAIREAPGAGAGKSINPQWSGDGASLFFVSDRSGISNVYRVRLADGAVTQVTDVPTGVSGITASSPALSVARRADRMAFAVFENGAYQLRALDSREALAGFVPEAARPEAGVLPPAHPDSLASTARAFASLPDTSTFRTAKYRAGISLDHASQAGIGISAGSGGAAIGGGSAFYWSDMLGNHNLATLLQLSSSEGGVDKNLGLLVDYQNRRRRWIWGLQGYQIPYFTRDFTSDEGTFAGTPAVRYQDVRSWQIERALATSLAYPVSRAQRFELSAGFRNIDFQGEIKSQIFSELDGSLLAESRTPGPEDSIPSISLFTSGVATVFDNSVFGGTSPVAGQRYRLELSPVLGDLQFASVLGDYRRYQRLGGPLCFAGRVVHTGRYGRDSESSRISPLFIGYPGLIRGYDAQSFTLDECGPNGDCPDFANLFGSRIGVANLELRLPLLGALGVLRSPAVPPVEAAGFYDTGVAWTDGEGARFLGGRRSAVSSYGTSLRVNLLGFAVAEIAYVHPNDRPLKGWYWQFILQPGF